MAAIEEVTITVSQPYTLIAGGRSGLRPIGQRRDYTAEIDGRTFKQNSKSYIQECIREYLYRVHGITRVRFTFVTKGA